MALTKQARVLSEKQERVALHYLKATEHPERNTVMFLLSVKAGLRAKEIASGAFPFCGCLCCDLNSPVICHFFKVRPAASLVK